MALSFTYLWRVFQRLYIMRYVLVVICCFLMTANNAFGQATQDSMPSTPAPTPPPTAEQPTTGNHPPETPPKPISYSGGFGHFFTGPAWIPPQDLVDHLQSPEVFGSSFNWDNLAITTGFEGMAELHNLLVGGGGFGLLVQNMTADSGTVRFGFAGGYAKVGYVLTQNPRYFLSFTAGFGGGAMYVGIENLSEETPVYFSSQIPVFPGGDKDYFRGILLYDLALNNKLIATYISPNARKFGGFMLGL